ncbi:MAG: helix-turn-helix domain-containing protein [Methanomassiliicoccales archaeon]|nr:helix-turn-helix domain-containing protein [Methanomassiliicoccales archaeon]
MLPETIKDINSCQDLVQCAYSLNGFEVEVYEMLLETGPVNANELADLMGKDRSTVYRALQKMMTCGMVFRETRSIARGGYFHVYKAISRSDLREKLQGCIDDWYTKMKFALEQFGGPGSA